MPNLQIARFVPGLAWVYQGLVPKLLFLAPTEQAIWQSLGPNDATIRRVHYLNLLALEGLLLATGVFKPHFLNDTFNPVTTNLPMMALSLIAIDELKRCERNRQDL